MEDDDNPLNKKPKMDENQPNLIDQDSIKELTRKITQLGLQIQQKQQGLVEARQKIEEGTILTRNLSAITTEFDQFVGLILDKVESESDGFLDGEELLSIAASKGDLNEIKKLLEDNKQEFDAHSLLVSAFKHGQVEVVEHITREFGTRCAQLNLQELCYFYSQLKDNNMINKCRKCLKFIIDAMENQSIE